MSEPVKLAIQKKLTELLSSMCEADGYNHELNGRVFRGRAIFDEDDPIPMISILESPKEPEQAKAPTGSSLFRGDWHLMIQGFVDDDAENPTDPAYRLQADVKKILSRIRDEDDEFYMLQLPDNVLDFIIGSGVVRPGDELSSKSNFWLVATIKICEDMSNPFV